uniref:PHD-type domain-containing protein n=1 Tax=Panagrolaimus sp. PS1159 TaxID=55785 RepID=A0AC35GRW0_9BILA
MEATSSSTMVGDFSIRSTGSSHNSTKFNSTNAQKGRRLDNIAARLQPNRASSSTPTALPNGTINRRLSTSSNLSLSKQENCGKVTCHQCLHLIKATEDALACGACKKHVHAQCLKIPLAKDEQYIHVHAQCLKIPLAKDEQYMCPHCRKQFQHASTSVQSDNPMDCENYIDKPVKKRQALSNSTSSGSAVTSFSPSNQLTPTSSATNSSSSTPVATPQPSGNSRKSSVPPGSSSSTRYSIPPVVNTDFDGEQLPAQIPTGSSFTSSIDDDFSMIINSEEHS